MSINELLECPHCGKIIHGVSALKKHMKKCKQIKCNSCKDIDTCKCTFYILSCPKNQ